MRTLTRFALSLVASAFTLGSVQAQAVSNLNFETWSNRTTGVTGGVEAPQNWLTYDDIIPYLYLPAGQTLPSSTQTVSKSTDVHGGSFAAKIENKAYAPLQSTVVPGTLVLGSSFNPTTDGYDLSGAPFTGRPVQVQFYYKLTGADAVTDSAAVFLTLTRNVSGTTQEVAYRGVLLPAAATYTLFTLPLTYTTATLPDSIHLTFTSSNARHTPSTTTALFVDDISLGTVTATRNPELQAAVGVSPNPSTDGRFVLNSSEPALLAAPLTVLDATGRVVRREAAADRTATRTLDLSDLPTGIYTMQLATDRGLVTRKLVR